jgi:hypothetical protein
MIERTATEVKHELEEVLTDKIVGLNFANLFIFVT